MSKEVDAHSQPESLFVGHVSETVSQIQNESPIISQQQIEPINLKYSPGVNLRTYSYFAILIGLIACIGTLWAGSLSEFIFGNTLCFFSFAIASFMDASYSKGKSNWDLSVGQSNLKSTIGMIFDIILGMVFTGIVVFVLYFMSELVAPFG